jgi:hypothetical protein
MRPLDGKALLVSLLTDLYSAYVCATGSFSDDFIRQLYSTALAHEKVSDLQLAKYHDLRLQLQNAMEKLNLSKFEDLQYVSEFADIYDEFESTDKYLDEIGYVYVDNRTLIEVSRRIEEENYDPCIEEAHK